MHNCLEEVVGNKYGKNSIEFMLFMTQNINGMGQGVDSIKEKYIKGLHN